MEQREILHEMVRQSFNISSPPPKYSNVSPLAEQYGVSNSTNVPKASLSQAADHSTEPQMVDSHGQPYFPTVPHNGGIEASMKDDDSQPDWCGSVVDSVPSRIHRDNDDYAPLRIRRDKRSLRMEEPDSSIPPKPMDRYYRGLSAKPRPKFEKISWNGMHTSFSPFRCAIEGHLLQVGAGYLTSKDFLDCYKILGEEYLKSEKFWNTYKVSFLQALYDMQYLYGILVTATKDMQHKIILKYEASQDGILAWDEFKKDFVHDGSEDLKIEQL